MIFSLHTCYDFLHPALASEAAKQPDFTTQNWPFAHCLRSWHWLASATGFLGENTNTSQIQIQTKNTKHRLFYLKDVSTQNWPNACSLAHPVPQDTSVKTGGNWIGSSNLSADYIAPGGHFSQASGSGEIIGKTIETAALWELPRTGNLLSRV